MPSEDERSNVKPDTSLTASVRKIGRPRTSGVSLRLLRKWRQLGEGQAYVEVARRFYYRDEQIADGCEAARSSRSVPHKQFWRPWVRENPGTDDFAGKRFSIADRSVTGSRYTSD